MHQTRQEEERDYFCRALCGAGDDSTYDGRRSFLGNAQETAAYRGGPRMDPGKD